MPRFDAKRTLARRSISMNKLMKFGYSDSAPITALRPAEGASSSGHKFADKIPCYWIKIPVRPILRANIDRKRVGAFLPTSVQCILAVAALACKVCAWCVTKTLTKPFREMAVISKTGCVRNLSERLTCAMDGLAL